uniref:Isochorismatase-like domain-containing protein n=1 Tax=Alexandrium monilatum TaxID=311494 RepID=A0A7S4PTA9_9DINO
MVWSHGRLRGFRTACLLACTVLLPRCRSLAGLLTGPRSLHRAWGSARRGSRMFVPDALPRQAALQGGPRPHTALLLIDCQKAFLTGSWALHFGLDQVKPIENAFRNTIELLRKPERLAGCAVLCTRCYLDTQEAEFDDDLRPLLDGVPYVWKPTTDVTRNPKFHDWFEERLAAGVRTLVVGGCTTTSCVRVSSQAVRKQYRSPDLKVVVDLSLCGARTDNLLPNADQDPDLLRIYGPERCKGSSPVDLAVLQMRNSGVEVVDSFDWEAHVASMAGAGEAASGG